MTHDNSNRDKTVFRQAKHLLHEAGYTPDTQLLSALIHSLPLNIFGKDLDGTFIPDLPVILSSGYSINGRVTDILKRGADSFIQKPFSLSELSQVVRKVLDTL